MPAGVKDMTLLPVDEPATKAIDKPQPDVVSQIVALASDPGMDVAKLEKLIDMQERVMRSQAEAAFNQAFSAMQGDIPTVIEKAVGDKGMTYAPLEDIMEVLRPILKRHGFSLSHKTEWPEKGLVKIVGILAHQLGHARQSEFVSAADNSGSKNAIQALGSAISYGRRYTANDLLGIVTRKYDNDGATVRDASSDAPEPAGYAEWLADLETAAMLGTRPMMEAWNKAKSEFRNHLIRSDKKRWETIKTTAATVTSKGGVK